MTIITCDLIIAMETGQLLLTIIIKIYKTSKAYFFCGSFMLFLSCVCYTFVRICLLLPCGHLLGKG